MTEKTIGIILKNARIKLNLSAEDVAGKCNVSRSRIYQWEAGERVFPKNLAALSAALNISMRRLIRTNGSRSTRV